MEIRIYKLLYNLKNVENKTTTAAPTVRDIIQTTNNCIHLYEHHHIRNIFVR